MLICVIRQKGTCPVRIVGLSAYLCVDSLSNVALSIGSPIACIAVFVLLTDLLRELHAETTEKKEESD